MKKMMKLILVLIGIALMASACSSGSNSAAATQTADTQTTSGVDANTPLSSRLAIGTLQLEGTDLAVTAEQAKILLPLWKAVNSMSNSDTATATEIQAIYDQIQESMMPEQIVAIEAMEMTQEEMTALMSKLGIEPGQFGGGNMANLTEDQRATQIAQFRAQGGFPSGEIPSGGERPSFDRSSGGGTIPGGQGGGMGPGGMGGIPEGMGGVVETTPGAVTARRGGFGMNQIFINPLIKLLEERSAS